jgi:DNA (cytosine-5)-methyltransferase 1
MKYLSLFSGIGGFELGIQQAYEEILRSVGSESTNEKSEQTKFEVQFGGKRAVVEERHSVLSTNDRGKRAVCIGYSEIDKYAIQIFEKHYPKIKNYGDITTINISKLPDFDLICGGFPCQSFSIAGKRGGFNDTRGTLFFDIARIIKAKRPRLLLLENVRGLLSHDGGRTFNTIIGTLDELGYDIQWQVLNSKNFGVPQNRERVFIIGHLRGTARPKVFPIRGNSKKDNTIHKRERQIAQTINATYARNQSDAQYIRQLNQPKQTKDLDPKIVVVGELNSPTWEKRHESIRRVYGTNGVAPTVPTGTGGGVMPKIEVKANIRRLTPTECERLQGFPDGWTKGVSDTQRYKTLGNAVTVNVIKEIMKRLLKEE